MKIGTTSFGFRYLLLDASRAPALETIVDDAAGLGLDVLQICENARPLNLSWDQWRALAEHAAQRNVEITLGCKTTRIDVFQQYLERVTALSRKDLRIVFEEEQGKPPARRNVDDFLAAAVPLAESAGVRMAIENHFDVPSRVLAEAVEPYPPEVLGFCVDTANSLRNFESPQEVMARLGPRAFYYHLKDFRVDGHLLGFQVGGAPLGQGKLDVDWFLDIVLETRQDPEIYLENWVPPSGVWEQDVASDDTWLRSSLNYLLDKLRTRGVAAGRRD